MRGVLYSHDNFGSNVSCSDLIQRDNGTEYIALNELRYSTGIQLGVFIGVAHTGTKFVSKPYFSAPS